MASRFKRRAAIVLALLVLAGSFAFVGFAAAEHRTEVQRQVATSAIGGASMTVPDAVSLYVVATKPPRAEVETAFVTAFGDRGIDVQVVTDIEPTADRPVLLVAVREFQLAYNPVTPSAIATVSFEYAADGNVTQYGQDGDSGFDPGLVDERLHNGDRIPLVLDDRNTLFRGGEIHLTDGTRGVITWPGYRAHVLDALGAATVDSLLADGQ
jgi:hypothetical protein